MRQFVRRSFEICLFAVSYCCIWGTIAEAQVTSDNTVNTTVNQNGNVSEIIGGQTEGNNLFHSFQDFSVPTGNEASFNNADTIENIFSRVTGGNVSNIDGLISANGSASLFLINPAGIIFGENASLNIGGSFIGSSADSILFPDDIAFSASDTQAEPILIVNAPIGLGFRDNPGDIVNRSVDEDLTGLEVPANETIALIGGDVLFDGGFMSTSGGRIEIGSVAGNSTLSLSEVEKGWDIGYEDVADFRDINLAFAAFVESSGENTGDVRVRGKNITLKEGSQIGIDSSAGQAGNLFIIASESLEVSGNGLEAGFDNFSSSVFNNVSEQASGENSQTVIEASQLNISNGGEITARNFDSPNQGVDVSIKASEILLDGTINFNIEDRIPTGIFAQTLETAKGNGGSVNINAAELTLDNGAQINTETLGVGNAGNLVVNTSNFVELAGINSGDYISGLFANTRPTQADIAVTGNGGNIIINTPKLIVKNGGTVASSSLSQGTGGSIMINAFESILLSGNASTASRNFGRTGISVGTANTLNELVPTTGNAGSLDITTKNLTIDEGALISAGTLSLGNGGNTTIEVDRLTLDNGGQIRASSLLLDNAVNNELGQGGNLNIAAKESVSITGTGDINGEPVNSSISTVAEGTGDAGKLILATKDLAIAERGEINASATGSGSAGNLEIDAQSASLERGSIRASTLAGQGGNISLDIADNLTLRDESQISAAALGTANGGNININSDFILAFPSQPDGSNIVAKAEQGTGGNIEIFTESLLGIDPGEAILGDANNDIDASSEFGLDGRVTINALDLEPTQDLRELPENVTDSVETTTQACQTNLSARANTLVLEGKGGISRPDEPLNSTAILLEPKRNEELNSFGSSETLQTNLDKIVPAQGVTVNKDGQITLTSYPTDNSARNYLNTYNCS